VYRLWASDGTCLYVGQVGGLGNGNRLSERFWEHRKKPWWPLVVRKEVAIFTTAAEVIAEERAQIAALKPNQNRMLQIVCGKGHDLTLPDALIDGRRCKRCQHEREASPQAKARRRARDSANRLIKNSRNRASWHRNSRRPSSGQQAMW